MWNFAFDVDDGTMQLGMQQTAMQLHPEPKSPGAATFATRLGAQLQSISRDDSFHARYADGLRHEAQRVT